MILTSNFRGAVQDPAGLRRIEVEDDVGHLDVKLRDRQGPDIAGAVPFIMNVAAAPEPDRDHRR